MMLGIYNMPCISTSYTVMAQAQALVDGLLLAAVKHHTVEARIDLVLPLSSTCAKSFGQTTKPAESISRTLGLESGGRGCSHFKPFRECEAGPEIDPLTCGLGGHSHLGYPSS